MKAAHSKAVCSLSSQYTLFESYVKAAHSKAEIIELLILETFENYVKAAHSKACTLSGWNILGLRTLRKNTVLRMNSWHCLVIVAYGCVNPLI